MAAKTILNDNQQRLLRIIGKNNAICQKFYLTGGTALAEFYLHHRLSEDLDFFSEQEFDPSSIAVFLKSIKRKIGIKKIAIEQSFNRNLYFLHVKNSVVVKLEFTFFPFPAIEKRKKINNLPIDSLLDIAVNKIFTIYQKPRARDFIDLYFICQKTGWTINNLIAKAKIKFDWHLDPLQLGSQFLRAREVKDYPRMMVKINDDEWQKFFLDEAIKLKKKILK